MSTAATQHSFQVGVVRFRTGGLRVRVIGFRGLHSDNGKEYGKSYNGDIYIYGGFRVLEFRFVGVSVSLGSPALCLTMSTTADTLAK